MVRRKLLSRRPVIPMDIDSYTMLDPIGIELSGALKNVYAIASGMSDGLGFLNNTRASTCAPRAMFPAQLIVSQ